MDIYYPGHETYFEGHHMWTYIYITIKPFFEGHQMWRYITLVRPSSREQRCDESQSGLHSSEDDTKIKKYLKSNWTSLKYGEFKIEMTSVFTVHVDDEGQ